MDRRARGDRAAATGSPARPAPRRIAGGAWEVAARARPRARRRPARAGAARLRRAEPRSPRPAQAPDPLSAQAGWRDFVVGRRGAAAGHADEPADRARRHGHRPEPPRDRRLEHRHAGRQAARRLPRHGDRDGRRRARQRRRDARHLARARARSTCRCRTASRSSARTPRAAIARAVQAGAAVINMSYGSPTRAAPRRSRSRRPSRPAPSRSPRPGTSSTSGNPLEFPASLPHVLTVGAIGPDEQPDVVLERERGDRPLGPGHRHPHRRPGRFDPDGTADGFSPVTAPRSRRRWWRRPSRWIRAARPDLTPLPGRRRSSAAAHATSARAATKLDRLRGAQPARRAGAVAAGGRSAGAQRRRPLGRRPGLRGARARALQRPAGEDGRRRGRPGRGPGRRLPRSRSAPATACALTLTPSRSATPTCSSSTATRAACSAGAAPSRARRSRRGTDRVAVRNRGGRTTTFYVAVGFDKRKQLKRLDARYTLRVALSATAARARAAPTAPRRGRRCRRAPRAWGRAGCRAGTTRRPAPPGSPMPAAVTACR